MRTIIVLALPVPTNKVLDLAQEEIRIKVKVCSMYFGSTVLGCVCCGVY